MMLTDHDMPGLKAVDHGGSSRSPANDVPIGNALLLACRNTAKSLKFRKGRDVVMAGIARQFLYVNHDGWLSRYKILHDGCRQIVNFVLPGEIFGLPTCAFRNSLYSVTTITECSLSMIPVQMVMIAAERNPRLLRRLFLSAIGEAAILGEHLIGTARRSAYGRVGHFLLELFVRLERGGHTESLSFDLPLTQETIADALGLSPVHVNRTLSALRADSLIALEGKRVIFLDFPALSRICDFDDSYLGECTPLRREQARPLPGFGLACAAAAAPS